MTTINADICRRFPRSHSNICQKFRFTIIWKFTVCKEHHIHCQRFCTLGLHGTEAMGIKTPRYPLYTEELIFVSIISGSYSCFLNYFGMICQFAFHLILIDSNVWYYTEDLSNIFILLRLADVPIYSYFLEDFLSPPWYRLLLVLSRRRKLSRESDIVFPPIEVRSDQHPRRRFFAWRNASSVTLSVRSLVELHLSSLFLCGSVTYKTKMKKRKNKIKKKNSQDCEIPLSSSFASSKKLGKILAKTNFRKNIWAIWIQNLLPQIRRNSPSHIKSQRSTTEGTSGDHVADWLQARYTADLSELSEIGDDKLRLWWWGYIIITVMVLMRIIVMMMKW